MKAKHPLCEIVMGRENVRGLIRMIHSEGFDLP